MSGPAYAGDVSDDLTNDPGVLTLDPVFEVGGTQAVVRNGGLALVHWRGDLLRAPGVTVVEQAPQPPSFSQAIVRLSKGRLAGEADIAHAWRALLLGGQLLLHGQNDIGVVSFGKRLAVTLQQVPQMVANRARGRVLRFMRGEINVPMPAATMVPLDSEDSAQLQVEPGVFSSDGLDEGTRVLQAYLVHHPTPKTVVDIGCGAGHLALAALRRWPSATGLLLDADRRAIRSAISNAASLGLSPRVKCQWWDVSEGVPVSSADLVLINPPCHAGVATDYGTARRMFQVAAKLMTLDGQVLVVANRQLPYEADLATLGKVRVVHQQAGFKILALTSA